MSIIKYRLRELLPSLSAQAKACRNREIKQRLYLIKKVVNSKREIKAGCEFIGLSRDNFYEWSNRLLEKKNILALAPISRRPKHSPNQTKLEIEKKIVELRNKKPFQGPETLAVAMEDTYAINIPPSTVYAVLVRNNLISEEYKKRITKKHMKRYRRPIPGYLQMDFKYLPYLVLGMQYYQLSAVDHCTSWRFIRIYRRKNEESVIAFLKELNLNCPFPIFEIQTDNDAAFTDKYSVGHGIRPTGCHPFDEWCKYYGCRHKLIPIGEKEINGKVENTHKYDDREFFSQVNPINFEALRVESKKYNYDWNEERKTKTLGWRTPSQLLEEIQTSIQIWIKFCFGDQPETQLEAIPTEIKSQSIQKSQFFPKSKKAEDRYLAWMAWEAAQYPKYTLIAVSGMSQIFSGVMVQFTSPKQTNTGHIPKMKYTVDYRLIFKPYHESNTLSLSTIRSTP